MRNFLYILLVFTFFGCKTSQDLSGDGMAPNSVLFDIQKTKSPITGDVPSHLVHQLLNKDLGNNYKNKATKVYPNTWTPVDDRFASLSVTQIVSDPTNSMVYYFCTGEGWYNADAARGAGIWKSIDAGETWNQLPSTLTDSFFYCQDMMVHPVSGDVYVATRTAGLMRSEDGGDSWEKVLYAQNGSSTNLAADLEITANNEIVAAFGIINARDGIYISSTGDLNDWQKIMNGMPTSNYGRIEIATAPSNENVMYAVPYRPSDRLVHGVYKSTDKGQSWNKVSSPGGNDSFAKRQAWYDLIVEVDPNNAEVVAVGGLNVFRSQDGGNNWTQIFEGDYRKKSPLQYVHVDQHNIIFQNSDTVYFLNDGGIWRTDHFQTDTPFIYDVNLNYNTTQFYSCDIAPQAGNNLVLGGTQDNGSNASTGDNTHEFKRISWADGSYCAIDHENGDYLYTTTQYARVYRTYEGEVDTITNPYITHGQNGNTLFINPLHLDVNDPQLVYQATNTGLWALFNARTAAKEEWKQVSNRFGTISAIATSRAVPNTAFVARVNAAYRIENIKEGDENNRAVILDRNGELPNTGVYLNCLVPDDQDSNHLIAIFTNYDILSVYETFDAYADDPEWHSCEGNLPNIPVRWGCFKNGSSEVFFLATEFGIYSTDNLDGENTIWVQNNKDFPNLRVDMIKSRISDNRFVAGTHGRGIYTGVADENNVITWTERGPSNVAGRTRTIMLDPNDASGKKIWAGSVSGGLWVIQDIDSTSEYYEVAESTVLDVIPNPASSYVILKFNEENSSSIEVDIYNNLGQKLLNKTIPSSAEYHLDLGGVANGIIYVSLKQGEEQLVKKIIKTGE
jgi:photosystem II stability/assembly factor-like uncharacterized protein